MDELLNHLFELLLARSASAGEATQFFDRLKEDVDQAQGSWMEFVNKLDALGQELGMDVRNLQNYLEGAGQLDPLMQLFGQHNSNELTAMYEAHAQQQQGGGAADAAGQTGAQGGQSAGQGGGQTPTQEQAGGFNDFLQQTGSTFNGDDNYWPTWRDWFLGEANQRGFSEQANAFATACDNANDKRAVFAQYGVTIN